MGSALFYRRNPLAFPSGVDQGVDFSHPATEGLRFSGVASSGGANFINLLQGTKGTITNTPTFAIDGLMGPIFGARGTLVSTKTVFTGQPTINDTTGTIAAIVKLRTTNTGQVQVLFNSSGTALFGISLLVNGNVIAINYGGVGAVNSVIVPLALVPYLFIGSFNGTNFNFLACRLDTGQTQIDPQTFARGSPLAPNGTYVVGNDGSGDSADADIAAAMFSANFMTLPEMQAWAAAPWAFWYPPQAMSLVAAAAAAPTTVLYSLMNVG